MIYYRRYIVKYFENSVIATVYEIVVQYDISYCLYYYKLSIPYILYVVYTVGY